jgi:hypothetical protein
LNSLKHIKNPNDSQFHYLFSSTLKSYLSIQCFQDATKSPSPLPTNITSNIFQLSSIFLLAITHAKMLLKDCQSSWTQLYSDQLNGTNFGNFCDALIGYEGPTIILIRDTNGFVFGMLSRDEWKYSSNFFGPSGGVGCCLFQLEPTFQLLNPQKRRGANTNYQWMNCKRHRKDLPHGIGMGGESDFFRFLLTPTFKNCISRPTGLTYELGQIASNETFDVGTVEIWGCGGKNAAAKREEKKEEERLFQESRRKVDKKQLLDGFTTEFLLSNTFKHRKEQNDRGGGN